MKRSLLKGSAIAFLMGIVISVIGFTLINKKYVAQKENIEVLSITSNENISSDSASIQITTPTLDSDAVLENLTPTPQESNSPSPTPSEAPTLTPTPTSTPITIKYTQEEIQKFFERFSALYSIDINVLRYIAICESGFNPDAKNGNYYGLFQFSENTWKKIRKEIGEEIDPNLRLNPEEATQTAAYAMSKNYGYIWPNCLPK